MRLWVINPLYHLHSCITSKIFVVKPMNIPATKEEILENFKQNSNGRPLNKDDYEIAEALSRITYKAYDVGMKDAKQLNMEDMMDNKKCNALHVFKNSSFGPLRTIEEDGKILFCATDVAKALGYINPRDAISRHCRGVVKRDAPTQGGIQAITFIPEGDVYRLITHSKLPGAEKFESWVFDEVLPSLRKDGYYSLAPQENKPDAQNDAILQVLMKNTEVLQAIAVCDGRSQIKAVFIKSARLRSVSLRWMLYRGSVRFRTLASWFRSMPRSLARFCAIVLSCASFLP